MFKDNLVETVYKNGTTLKGTISNALTISNMKVSLVIISESGAKTVSNVIHVHNPVNG